MSNRLVTTVHFPHKTSLLFASFFTELCKNMYAHCITHNYDNIKFLIICQLDENDMSNDTFEQYKSDKVSNRV